MTTAKTKYVVAFAGSRDDYQAALALHEGGLLARLVTDLYVPDRVANRLEHFPDAVRRRLERRYATGLPSKLVRSVPQVVAYRRVMERLHGQYRALRVSDQLLGRYAAEEARRARSASLVYSYYWPGFLQRSAGRGGPNIVFQVHPVPTHIKRVLAEDRERTGINGWLDEEEVLPASVAAEFEASLHSADGFIVPSSFVRAGLLEVGIPGERIAVVPYGCSPGGQDERGPDEARHGPLRLLWVGQASYRKGAHHLLAALRSLPPGTATLSMVCRSGDLGLLGKLPPGTEVVRGVSSERLDELYASHDVFVMPSLAEGFGLVYLEAMSHGLPVIATGNTGVADIAESDAILILPPGAPEPLANMLSTLAADRDGLAARRQAARQTAGKMTWASFRSNLRSALDRLAG